MLFSLFIFIIFNTFLAVSHMVKPIFIIRRNSTVNPKNRKSSVERKSIHCTSLWQLIEMETCICCYQKTFSSAVSRCLGQCHDIMTSITQLMDIYTPGWVSQMLQGDTHNSAWTFSNGPAVEMPHLFSIGFPEWRASPLSNQTLWYSHAEYEEWLSSSWSVLMKINDYVDGLAAMLSVTLIGHLTFYVLADLSLCCTEKHIARFCFYTLF